jgi:phosphoglycerol transferase MdoB-like AlkP superfamily enzyme
MQFSPSSCLLNPNIFVSILTLNTRDIDHCYYQFIPDDYARLVIQSYYAAVSYIDDLVGQLLLELKAADLFNTTIILLIGDHGKYEHTFICTEFLT